MTKGKDLLQDIGRALRIRESRITRQGQQALKRLGLPEADKIHDFDKEGFIRFGYDLGDSMTIQFDWLDKDTREGVVEIAVIDDGEDVFLFEDIDEGEKAVVGLKIEELREDMPERSTNYLTILSWIRHADDEVRERAEWKKTRREFEEAVESTKQRRKDFQEFLNRFGKGDD